jgi:hypothetical protein
MSDDPDAAEAMRRLAMLYDDLAELERAIAECEAIVRRSSDEAA